MSQVTSDSASGSASSVSSVEAFTRLAEEFYQPVYRFLIRLAPSTADAADLTQQTFIRAFKGFHHYQPSRAFAPWIYTIARRTVADFYRANPGLPVVDLKESLADSADDPRVAAEVGESAASVWLYARQLKPKFHQILLLHYQEGFSVQESARIMGISLTHAKVLLFRARGALRQSLEAAGHNGGYPS